MSDRSIFGPKGFLPLLIGLPIGVFVFQVVHRDAVARHEGCRTWAKVLDQLLPSLDAAVGSDSNTEEGIHNLTSVSRYYEQHPNDEALSFPSSAHLLKGLDEVLYGIHGNPARVARGLIAVSESVDDIAHVCTE